jgi:CRP-like cAMP-binding protein
MNANEVRAVLCEIGFFHGLAEEHLDKLAEVARVVDFPEGKVIFREGDPASSIYLLVSGTVSVELCAPGVGCRRILTASAGDLLGWSPVLEQARLTATARTMSPVRALQISGGQLLTICEHNPRLGYAFMRRTALALAKRLSATRMQLLDVFGNEMPTAESPR